MSSWDMKRKILTLLREDEEFKYAVAGLLGMEEILRKLAEHDKKFNEIVAKLAEHDKKFNEIVAEIKEIRSYMDRTSISLEEEAREVISYKLRERGIDISLRRLFIEGLEVDIYGCTDDLCVVGEVTTRLGVGLVKRILGLVEEVRRKVPEVRDKRILAVIYTLWATPESIEEAEKRGIWVVEALRELTPFNPLD